MLTLQQLFFILLALAVVLALVFATVYNDRKQEEEKKFEELSKANKARSDELKEPPTLPELATPSPLRWATVDELYWQWKSIPHGNTELTYLTFVCHSFGGPVTDDKKCSEFFLTMTKEEVSRERGLLFEALKKKLGQEGYLNLDDNPGMTERYSLEHIGPAPDVKLTNWRAENSMTTFDWGRGIHYSKETQATQGVIRNIGIREGDIVCSNNAVVFNYGNAIRRARARVDVSTRCELQYYHPAMAWSSLEPRYDEFTGLVPLSMLTAELVAELVEKFKKFEGYHVTNASLYRAKRLLNVEWHFNTGDILVISSAEGYHYLDHYNGMITGNIIDELVLRTTKREGLQRMEFEIFDRKVTWIVDFDDRITKQAI